MDDAEKAKNIAREAAREVLEEQQLPPNRRASPERDAVLKVIMKARRKGAQNYLDYLTHLHQADEKVEGQLFNDHPTFGAWHEKYGTSTFLDVVEHKRALSSFKVFLSRAKKALKLS